MLTTGRVSGQERDWDDLQTFFCCCKTLPIGLSHPFPLASKSSPFTWRRRFVRSRGLTLFFRSVLVLSYPVDSLTRSQLGKATATMILTVAFDAVCAISDPIQDGLLLPLAHLLLD